MKAAFGFLLVILLNTSNCSKGEKFKELKFGEGGGFTGLVTEFRLKEDGKLYLYNALDKEERFVKTLKEDELKTLYKKITDVPKDAWNISHPYNLYYFVEVDTIKSVWGDPSYQAPKALQDLYEYLRSKTYIE